MSDLSRKSVSTRLAGVVVMVVAGLLAACGQKGPLTLPKPAATAAAGPAPAAPAASAPAVPR
ncbi:MAG: LPS translocon maturation chaperone LptM [Betaproteobacteria bacterium]|jgi:predicted small lipoprotein YifL|nr:lipoprotein [Burkholderiaceae bacterium]